MKSGELARWIRRNRVLLALYMHTDRYEFAASPRYKTLADELGITINQLKASFTELKQLGLIRRCGEGDHGGSLHLLIGHPDCEDYQEYWHTPFRPKFWTRDWRERSREIEVAMYEQRRLSQERLDRLDAEHEAWLKAKGYNH